MNNLPMKIILSSVAATCLLGLSIDSCPDNLVLNNQNDGNSSLRVCINNAAPNSTILFDNDFTIVLESEIEIEDTSLAIDGTNHKIIIDGNENSDIFMVSNSELNISKITIQDANASFGAAVNIEYSSLNIVDSNLSNNESEYGGAIYSYNSTINISNSTISNNIARSEGGAIYAYSYNDIQISNSTISANSAEGMDDKEGIGGAIYASYGNTINISSSTINNNRADLGGAIAVDESDINIDDSTISFNNAVGVWVEDGHPYTGYAGGISSNDSNITITKSNLNENNASESGGALFLMNSSALLSESSFNSNMAEDYGGAISMFDSNVTIDMSTVAYNIAYYSGAIDNYKDNRLTISNSTIGENNANGDSTAIYLYEGVLTLEHTTITNNSSDDNTLPAIAGYADINVSNSIISGNTGGDFVEILSLGNNILGTGNIIDEKLSDILTTNPMLGELSDNGGLTLTHLPLANSPAINAGLSTLEVDQRGVTRPQGDSVDIGSVEVESDHTVMPAIIMYLLN